MAMAAMCEISSTAELALENNEHLSQNAATVGQEWQLQMRWDALEG